MMSPQYGPQSGRSERCDGEKCTCFTAEAWTMVRSAGSRPPHRRSRDGGRLRPQNLNWVHETDPLYHPNGCYKATEEYNVLYQGLLSTFFFNIQPYSAFPSNYRRNKNPQ